MPEKSDLKADCGNCFALCCVALPFAASADFAIDKDAGVPCPNLESDYRCGVHSRLRTEGFPGCTSFDCFGAGQQISQVTFGGQDWRRSPDTARKMFEAFPVMRGLHELLWYLTEALSLGQTRPIHSDLRRALEETSEATRSSADALISFDVPALRARANELLLRTSDLVRAEISGRKQNRRGADLVGADLRRVHLRGADLRGAYLIAADLRGTDLTAADLIGADLRNTDVRGADLSRSLFLTQSQTNAARGDQTTGLPGSLDRPSHWSFVGR